MPRVKDRYAKDVVPQLMKTFSYTNVMQAPRLSKIVVNMGVGEASLDAKLLEASEPTEEPTSVED